MIKKLITGSIVIVILLLTNCNKNPTENLSALSALSRETTIPASQQKIYPEGDNYPPILHSDEWENPIPLEGPVNSAGLEDSPFITPDGNTLFLFFTPSATAEAENQITDGATGIYISYKTSGGWTKPERVWLSQEGDISLDGCPTFVGDTLWFCSIRQGNYRDIDIWTARLVDENWVDIKNAGQTLNQEFCLGELHVNHTSQEILFHANSSSPQENLDIWKISAENETWSEPVNLSAVNSNDDDSRPALSPDEKELWFTRTYNGTPAIFRSVWEDGSWQTPELIISQFAGEPSVDQEGNVYFTHHFYKNGEMLEADIYIIYKK